MDAYSIGLELAAMGFFFRERFLNLNLIAKNGWTLFGSPTINNGLVLNGTTQYARKELSSLFHSQSLTIYNRFTPTFAHDDGNAHYILDVNPTGDYSIEKTAANALELYLGNTLIVSVAAGTYGAYWYQNLENILIVTGTDTDTSIWLNGHEIASSVATSWTPTQPSQITIGATHAGGSLFAGTFHEVMFGDLLFDDISCPQLTAGTIISDLSDKRSVITLPLTEILVNDLGETYTPIHGSSVNKQALMGSDGLTPSQMPTKLPKGGVALDGSQFITLPDEDGYTFSIPGGGDLPFSVGFRYKPGNITTLCGLVTKDVNPALGEWLVAQGIISNKISFVCYDQSVSAYIYITVDSILITDLLESWVCVYDGSGTTVGMKIYRNGLLAASTAASVGSYTQMRNSTVDVQIGKYNVLIVPAGSEIHVVEVKPYEMSAAQARAWTRKAESLNRGR